MTDIMKKLGMVALLLSVGLVSTLLHAWAATVLWSWFVAAQYGRGPSLGAWCGLIAIAQMAVVWPSTRDLLRDDGMGVSDHVFAAIYRWVVVLLTLGLLWCLGAAAGWIR
jgi:hypothetical protein